MNNRKAKKKHFSFSHCSQSFAHLHLHGEPHSNQPKPKIEKSKVEKKTKFIRMPSAWRALTVQMAKGISMKIYIIFVDYAH